MSKQKEVKKVSYVCAIYGGNLKLGVVRYFATENTPDSECEKYKETYGKSIKARYIKVNDTGVDSFKKLKVFLSKQENIHDCGDLYDLSITKAVKLMKDALDVKKARTWGFDVGDDDEDDKETNTTNKDKPPVNTEQKTTEVIEQQTLSNKSVVVKGKTKKEAKPIDTEPEDEPPSDQEKLQVVDAPVVTKRKTAVKKSTVQSKISQ